MIMVIPSFTMLWYLSSYIMCRSGAYKPVIRTTVIKVMAKIDAYGRVSEGIITDAPKTTMMASFIAGKRLNQIIWDKARRN